MALSQEILDESELVKSKITNSECIDDDYKRLLLKIVNITTTATNGITPEEKILKMTEAIFMLAVSQVSFVTRIEDTVAKSIEKANLKQCDKCQALKHAKDIEQKENLQKLLEELKVRNNLVEKDDLEMSWQEIVKKLMCQPGMWIFLTILIISPYSVDIIKTVFQFFVK